ncbi:MAG TPA: ABC transporter permease [Verrucomicrobiae bacterium]
MNWLTQLWRRITYLARRDQLDADLAEEMRLHLELKTAAAGDVSVARKQFGNVVRLHEKSRDAWGWGWLDSVAQDLRYGWRNLMSARGFTVTAILSLALGIGANTAIFSIVNAMMLRSLPVPNPHRLARLSAGGGNEYLTNPLWESIREHQNAFKGVFAYSTDGFDLAQQGEKQIVSGLWVSGDIFNVLGVPAWRGRVFNREDDLHGGGRNGPVAVISHSFWQTHFGGDPNILGKPIQLDGHPFEIIGVTPPSFRGIEPERPFSVAIPIGCEPTFHPDGSALTNRSWWWLRTGGRLQDGLTIEQAVERLKAVAPAIMKETLPEWDERGKAEYLKRDVGAKAATTGFSGFGDEARTMLMAMMGVVLMVLLIACANIANLLLARAAARSQEISVRLAIGAGRRRLIRQLLTESILLALLGIPGGLFLAKWGSQFIVKMAAGRTGDDFQLDVSMDHRVLLFTVGISALTGVIFGLAPALRATRISTNEVLKQTTRGSGSRSRFRLGRALVAGQVALCLALIVAASLFVSTLRNLLHVSLGFNQHNILLVNYDARGHIPMEQRLDRFKAIQERLQQIPGVISASTTFITPISGTSWNGVLVPEGAKLPEPSDVKGQREMTWFNRVSPRFFETLQTPILMGRDFSDRDVLNGPKVIIISEKSARDLFGNESPIGKRVTMGAGPGNPEQFEVIGVVANSKYVRIREDTRRIGFLPLAQDDRPRDGLTYVVRAATPQFQSVIPAIKAVFAEVSPGSSIELKNFEHQVSDSISQQRLIAGLVTFFGALALLLAVVGLYGVTSYAAAQRRGEIGIRMALGAQRGSVIWLVLRDVAIILAIGSVVGLGMSFGAGKLIASLMYNVQPNDPQILIAAALILAAAGAIAGLIPALRASKLDPANALRYE